MTKRILLITAMSAVLLGIAATPANAAFSDCPPGSRVCAWQNINGGGSMYYWTAPNVPVCYNMGVAPNGVDWNNSMSSVKSNFGSYVVRLYAYFNCSTAGDYITIFAGQVTNLTAWSPSMNDRVSSLKISAS